MKRQAVGGAHRGPVGAGRQRRTVRFVQFLLALGCGAMIAFGIYSFADRTIEQGIVLIVIGVLSGGAAYLLADGPSVRIPAPARLDELAGRAERVAIDKAAD